MPQVRGGADKWKRRTAGAAGDYVAGAKNPRTSWAQATANAQDAYVAGVQDSITRGSFAKGVQNAGDGKWQQGVVQKGAARFAQGVNASGDNYARGFEPYRQVIENTQLPARGRRGDPANFERVRVLGTALNEAKNQRRGG